MNEAWLDEQLAGAPPELVSRTRHFLAGVSDHSPEGLARGAAAALAAAIAAGADRRGALDLLAADALVTLALAAKVEIDPAGLARFARSLLAEEPAAA